MPGLTTQPRGRISKTLLCSYIYELSKAKGSEWVDASLVSILDYEKLGRDSDMKDPRLSEHARPHLYQAQNIKLCALEVVPSMNATCPPELYYRLKGLGLLES